MSDRWDGTEFREAVQAALDDFLEGQSSRLEPLRPDSERLLTQARASVAGGKRFRAAFCYWGHRAVEPSPDDEPALVRACAAVELLHASALVHDDLMDASDTRRGRPSAHRVFAAEHEGAGWRGDPAAYGGASAILLGDLLLVWADELLRRAGFPVDRTAAALELFDATRAEVITGQFLDVTVQARGRADVDTAMTVLRYKSAKYSVERPLHLGAALGGGSAAQLAALSAFGVPVGEAFQLRDDLLGVFGDPDTTGKPAGDDLVEGKRTVLVALALDSAPPVDAARLDAALGPPLDGAQVAELRRIIADSGAAQQVETAIRTLGDHAVTALDRAVADSLLDESAAGVLRQLASAATQRVH